MVCTPLPGGGFACGPRQRRHFCSCGRAATRQCDWKVLSRKSGTCDAWICEECSTAPAPDKDVCPTHKPALQAWQAAQ